MRVHPSILAPRIAKWHYAVIGVLFLLLVVSFFGGSKEKQVVVHKTEKAAVKKVEVIVAVEPVEAGQPLENANLVLEQRPVHTLPADAVTTFDMIKNKIAAGPIPAGYPLASALLAEPVATLTIDESAIADDIPEDPIEILLKEIESETVALPIAFTAAAPQRGARVAVTLSKSRGKSVVVVEDAWVASSKQRDAILRLAPAEALLLQSAKQYGNFAFIEIPTHGPSPYEGKAVGGIEELKFMLEGKKVPVNLKADKNNKRKIKGYAWVPGEDVRYSIDDNGKIKVNFGD